MAATTITTGVDFGPGYVGLLGSVGYTVYTLSGGSFVSFITRTTSGIATSGSLVATTFSGSTGIVYFVAWDTGGSSPVTQWQIVPGQVFQSGDSYAINSIVAGIVLTGSVAASPTPTQTSFTINLDTPISGSAVANDIIGLYATFRSGARESSYRQISNCSITYGPPSLLALTTSAFAGAPTASDLVIISG